MITLLHTAQAHADTFDALRDRIAPDAKLVHLVRPGFLDRAQGGIDTALAGDIGALVRAAAGPVLCTCTTIGAVAGDAGAIRIDAPMMQAAAQTAAQTGGPVLLVYCLDSSAAPSGDLLQSALDVAGVIAPFQTLHLGRFWALFQAGEHDAFRAVIAAAVKAYVKDHPDISAVVLAQASMAGAATMLDDLSMPVFASPELALRAVLG
ncbi:hypothetical protein SuNHUV7_10560 (plasmid) [Pseudoseohaeicola sp. NH-UV-7]|uniref:hypothetical protein n=1 Tax=unclassified Sulfitobacter TaxID=196795 RepID=UPI000E0BD07C|nr:hypothetical protein [Sulfitobacter sp. JL08]AXI53258.1 hypothetical protein C1J05_00975 [Sulfitobacter sp. JL08]